MSDSKGLVDFGIGLVIFGLNLSEGQVLLGVGGGGGQFKLQKYCSQFC